MMTFKREKNRRRVYIMINSFMFSALAVMAIWVPSAMANATFEGCASCHTAIANEGPGHSAHSSGLACDLCHVNDIVNNPPIGVNCTQCHGRVQDAGGDTLSAGEGRGLRLHHQNAGVTCSPCHSDSGAGAPAGVAENILPAFYPGPSNLNPCDGSEENFPSNSVSLDNDGDLLTDGADPDCAPPTEICTDGIDNDNDGDVDCADTDCSVDPACQPEANCSDTIDNDNDGAIDCADTDCSADPVCLPEADCNDGVDNDSDGLTDCDDQDCASDPACQAPSMEMECADGVDNDNDNMIDCADPDCADDPACQPVSEDCNDGIDNDGDGMIDCDDSDCAEAANCQPPTIENCTDGVDNDGDGMIDCDDQDCADDPTCQQPVIEDCDDGVDNDNDGFIDCADPDCSSDPACETAETCPSFNPPANHSERKEADGCEAFHAPGYEQPYSNSCTSCHGSVLTGPDSGGSAPSCYTCHGEVWDEMPPDNGGEPVDHTVKRGSAFHKTGHKYPFINDCTSCHGEDLMGGTGPSCYTCHKMKWKDEGRFDAPADHTVKRGDNYHKTGIKYPYDNGCNDCHGSELTGEASGGSAPSCFLCHKQKWKDDSNKKHQSYRGHDGDDDDDRRGGSNGFKGKSSRGHYDD